MNEKIGVLVTARLGSTRLERKHLLPVLGKPVFSYLIGRAASGFHREIASGGLVIVIATSDRPENREFENFSQEGVSVFYGADTNIPLRHLQAAEALGLQAIVSIDGDDILCSIAAMRAAYTALSEGAEYVKTSGLPLGMNCMGYSLSFLSRCLKVREDRPLETGWGRIFDETHVTGIDLSGGEKPNPILRLTLDYEEDYKFFNALITLLGNDTLTASDEKIVETIMSNKLYDITACRVEEYMANFTRGMEAEINKGT